MKEAVAVIGLGSFGRALVDELAKSKKSIIAFDSREEKVGAVKDLVSKAVIADARDRDPLVEAGIEECSIAAVSLGDSLEASALVVLHLKELGIKHVVVKATSADHARLLERIGADEVIWPERESARLLGRRIKQRGLIDVIELGDGIEMTEVKAPASFVGKTLMDLNLRQTQGVQVVFVRTATSGRQAFAVPEPNRPFEKGDILFMVGPSRTLERVLKEFGGSSA